MAGGSTHSRCFLRALHDDSMLTSGTICPKDGN
jgi:hypothetical protein